MCINDRKSIWKLSCKVGIESYAMDVEGRYVGPGGVLSEDFEDILG